MKIYLLFASLIILISCKQNNHPESLNSKLITDSIKVFNYKLNIKDSLIINNSNKEIDLLINGSKNFLGGKYLGLKFGCDYIVGQPIEEYKGNIIFANRLLISEKEIKFYLKSIDTSKSLKKIESKTCFGEKSNIFKFKNGNGKIKFVKVSCNDTNLNDVILNYGKNQITIKNMINARFFEYDIDKDGINEEYLLGVRNCSQEIVILRIRNRK